MGRHVGPGLSICNFVLEQCEPPTEKKKKSCNRILVLSLLEPERKSKEYKELRITLQLQIASEMEDQLLKA